MSVRGKILSWGWKTARPGEPVPTALNAGSCPSIFESNLECESVMLAVGTQQKRWVNVKQDCN